MTKRELVKFLIDSAENDFKYINYIFNHVPIDNLDIVLKYNCAQFDSRSYGIILNKKIFLSYSKEYMENCLLELIDAIEDYNLLLKKLQDLELWG